MINGKVVWRYQLPMIFWLLYGAEMNGTVEAGHDRSSARAALKRKFSRHRYKMHTCPQQMLLEKQT